MSEQTDKLVPLIEPYGLSSDEAKIYLVLLEKGHLTALTISRYLRLGRTKVYRLLDKLIAKQLVVQHVDERGMKFAASDPRKLEQVVTQKQLNLDQLRQSLPQTLDHLHGLAGQRQSQSKILYYSGREGLEQVSYNSLRAKKLLRVYEVQHLSNFIDPKFAESIRQKMVETKIFTRDLTNQATFADFTQVAELIAHWSEFRYLDPQVLSIDFEVLIYNDVYAMYNYTGEEVFCVEIYNQSLAKMQKQLFDFIWNQAEKMVFTSAFGAAKRVGKAA